MKKYLFFIFLFTALSSKELYTNNLLKKINLKYGKYTENRFILLKKKINSVKNKSDIEKINMVNNFFNKVKYASDSKVWNKKDYWATPYEFLAKDKGDSEDFVFAKYFTLVNDLNISSNKLSFTYVKSKKKKVSYMVLTYYKTKKSIPIILDAINYKALPASKRQDIIPIYSFSAKSAGLDKKSNSKFKASQSLKFRRLLQNIREEKI
ncbi:transglutaminase-like cysteine peptidase [Poseidonibacter lekithochrous]|uniref:transglutaminase-like cysteine peptidase n=1 Tax=Poseidonibacter TaxID=2321187 RepID=UPI001C08377D|nr:MULTISPECIES: transglutaminase-like cysteine peptidase [Poseidonibacter]MBU3014091.1 transglutaminase-like cysteine peptidase [Poseidonibacter lekithochrous]MDO6827389.1 transglutaminase-like cysteine peptidase [Poseidonibacter sp. 1_MG-2023]